MAEVKRACALITTMVVLFTLITFGYFWLTIQNTTNRHVNNAFDLIAVFISFPLARAAAAVAAAELLRPRFEGWGEGDGPGKLIPRL